MNNTVKCTFCGKEIEISYAIKHEMEEEIIKETEARHKTELDKIKKDTEELIRKRLAIENAQKIKEKEEELLQLRKRNKELSEQMVDLSKEIRNMRFAYEKAEIEREKKINLEIEKARHEISKYEQEKSQFKILELQKQLLDTQKALDEAKNKSNQISQQLQGEVLELDLENKLRSLFIHDEIVSIGKGISGGDIIQRVRTPNGKLAGIILWETKRAKWSAQWLSKLREDARKIGATIPVLVSENIPDEIINFGMIEGVIVTTISYALPLATVLRRDIMQIAVAKSTAVNKDEKLERLYQYIQSDSFRHRFEAYVESVLEMQNDLAAEKRSYERIWKKRELQISKTLENISRMYGEFQGIVGQTLPDIKLLSFPDSG